MSAERGRQEMKIWAGGALREDGGEKDENERGGGGSLRSYPGVEPGGGKESLE